MVGAVESGGIWSILNGLLARVENNMETRGNIEELDILVVGTVGADEVGNEWGISKSDI